MTSVKIGRYELKEELGRGGMATVFLAYDPFFQREVALKIIPREFLHDSTFKSRFLREAKTIAILEHPAIVPVYDFGEEDGQPFLVMRYLPGGSLTNRLENSHLSLSQSVQVMNRIAPGLDEAHQLGIIHRDLKPDNILFDQRDDPYLTDFGIAKLAEEQKSLTQTGLIIGTPAYMSPEQANGEKIDGRSDIYALGIILFQMLTGQLPYEANTPIGLIMKHITQPIPQILAIQPDLPSGCEDVIAKALAKEPDDRFSTATELAGALRDVSNERFISSKHAESKRTKRRTTTSTLKRITPREPVKKLPTPTTETEKDTIICPKCQTANDELMRFCTTCGAQLRVDCPLCHTSNRVDESQCANCGANLQELRSKRKYLQKARRDSLAKRDQAFKEKAARQLRTRMEELFEESRHRKTRASAVRQLEQLVKTAVPTLAEDLLSNDEPEARRDSAIVLGKIYERPEADVEVKKQIIQAFVDALEDSEPVVRLEVEKLLEKYGRRRSREISEIFKGLVGWLTGD